MMKVRYIGNGGDLEHGGVYEVLGITTSGLIAIESGGPFDLLLPVSDFALTRYVNPGAGKFDVFYSGTSGWVIEEDESGVLGLGETFLSNLKAGYDYEPETTTTPQCLRCKLARECTRKIFCLYRRNLVRCPDRDSEDPFQEPDKSALRNIEYELRKNSRLYTPNELIEARMALVGILEKEGDLNEQLAAIEKRFHDVIEGRCHFLSWAKNSDRKMPRITRDLFVKGESEWFPVPGMYGGFAYQLGLNDGTLILTVESWYRIVGGSGQRHIITAERTELVKEGFV